MREKIGNDIKQWFLNRTFQLAIFNAVLVFLVLLRSAGYFNPYLEISINLIFITCLFMAVLLLGMRKRGAFIMSLIFLSIAMILRVLDIETWAERAALYSYEAFIAGLILLVLESRLNKNKK